jgi:hypothetical protein
MNRRAFVVTGLFAAAASSSDLLFSNTQERAWLELKFFHLRNDLDRSRLDKFLSEGVLPTLRKMGRSPVGVFNVFAGVQMPMLITLVCYPSLADMETIWNRLAEDIVWNKSLDELDQPKVMAYTRMESVLLRAFLTMPAIELPPSVPGRQAHIFELRTYQSRNIRASENKVKMFDEGEIEIFRKCGMFPTFFGQTIVGPGMPSLTYMLAFDSMEKREEAWRKFANHADWLKLRSKPGLADSELVSGVSNCFLRAADYSEIR